MTLFQLIIDPVVNYLFTHNIDWLEFPMKADPWKWISIAFMAMLSTAPDVMMLAFMQDNFLRRTALDKAAYLIQIISMTTI